MISNNIICDNSANGGAGIGAQSIHSDPVITNNTLYGNVATAGGAIYCAFSSAPVITNTICWNNSPDEIYNTFGSPAVTYSDIKGGWTGTGNIDADPLFVNSAARDFHLTWDSPCRDAGDNTASGLPSVDFEGDPRIHDGTADMGADEFHPHLYHAGDVVPGGPVDIKIIGPPAAPVTLALGSGIQDPPQPTPYGDLYLAFPLTQFKLGAVQANGVLV